MSDHEPAPKALTPAEEREFRAYCAGANPMYIGKRLLSAMDFHRLRADAAEKRAGEWIQALGLLSTLVPGMTIDVDNPLGMAQIIVKKMKVLKLELNVRTAQRDKAEAELDALATPGDGKGGRDE